MLLRREALLAKQDWEDIARGIAHRRLHTFIEGLDDLEFKDAFSVSDGYVLGSHWGVHYSGFTVHTRAANAYSFVVGSDGKIGTQVTSGDKIYTKVKLPTWGELRRVRRNRVLVGASLAILLAGTLAAMAVLGIISSL